MNEKDSREMMNASEGIYIPSPSEFSIFFTGLSLREPPPRPKALGRKGLGREKEPKSRGFGFICELISLLCSLLPRRESFLKLFHRFHKYKRSAGFSGKDARTRARRLRPHVPHGDNGEGQNKCNLSGGALN